MRCDAMQRMNDTTPRPSVMASWLALDTLPEHEGIGWLPKPLLGLADPSIKRGIVTGVPAVEKPWKSRGRGQVFGDGGRTTPLGSRSNPSQPNPRAEVAWASEPHLAGLAPIRPVVAARRWWPSANRTSPSFLGLQRGQPRRRFAWVVESSVFGFRALTLERSRGALAHSPLRSAATTRTPCSRPS